MNEESERIDALLQRNTAEQLTEVDWDRLNAAISTRLDEAEHRRKAPVRLPVVFKVAAVLIAVAAVVLAVLTLARRTRPGPTDRRTGYAAVEILKSTGFASVQIAQVGPQGRAIVDIKPAAHLTAKSDVRILDTAEDARPHRGKAAWIIITKPAEPAYADNGFSPDTEAMISLF